MKFKVKSRIWIESEEGVFLGEGRIHLLRLVDELGSISKAAKELKMSYKKAWFLLDSMNKQAPMLILMKKTGGKNGGGAELTKYGKKIIHDFEQLNSSCWGFLEDEFQKIDFTRY
ncbi:MAG: winged helix-turn-helix domain-containing protein [Flavobacteriales bacterium]